MNKNLKILVLGIVQGTLCLTANAQMDNVVEVENNYKPTVKDANKINSLPVIDGSQPNHYNVDYTTTPSNTTNYKFQPMAAAQNPALIKSDKKGFFTGAYGTNGNVMGRITYGFDLSDRDELDFDLTARGHKGDVESVFAAGKDWESRLYTNQFNADYHHFLDGGSSINLGVEYGNDVFNYQKSPFAVPAITDKQHNKKLGASLSLSTYKFGQFGIAGELEFANFRQKYSTSFADECTETMLGVSLTPSYDFTSDLSADIDLGIEHYKYGMEGVEGFTDFEAVPHVYYGNPNFDIRAGVYVNDELNIAPDVDINIHMLPIMDFYIKAHGGEVANDFFHFNQMSPYWALINKTAVGEKMEMESEFDQVRAQAGIRTAPIQGLFADLSAGYDIQEKRAELAEWENTDLAYAPMIYNPVCFVDGKHFYGTAIIDYQYSNILKAHVNATYNKWTVDKKWKGMAAEWRPEIDVDCNVSANVYKGLTLGADFAYQSFKESKGYNQPDVMSLGASLSYTLPASSTIFDSPITLYAKGDNLLNRNYDHYLMYRSPGINFLFGAAISF